MPYIKDKDLSLVINILELAQKQKEPEDIKASIAKSLEILKKYTPSRSSLDEQNDGRGGWR